MVRRRTGSKAFFGWRDRGSADKLTRALPPTCSDVIVCLEVLLRDVLLRDIKVHPEDSNSGGAAHLWGKGNEGERGGTTNGARVKSGDKHKPSRCLCPGDRGGRAQGGSGGRIQPGKWVAGEGEGLGAQRLR